MPSIINPDKLLKLHLSLKEMMASAYVADVKDTKQFSVKIPHLLGILVNMQTLNISIRSELIEKLFSARPDIADKIKKQIKNGKDNIILFDRRRSKPDRRKLHTFIFNDKRSGIADRRRRTKEQNSLTK
jgi:DNA-binding MarR family transcriptional regulator